MTVRYAVAKKAARDLLAKAKVKAAPVPVDKLAVHAKAVVRPRKMSDELGSGSVQWQPDGTAIIGVNASHVASRQRFTIAHELGHVALHGDADYHFDQKIRYRNDVSSRAIDEAEIEANQFAAELLMPEAFLKQDVDGLELDDTAIEDLARKYQVSVQAMTIRLTVLGYLR